MECTLRGTRVEFINFDAFLTVSFLKQILKKWTVSMLRVFSTVFEGQCLLLPSTNFLCRFQSLPKPYKHTWDILLWKPLNSSEICRSERGPVTPECDHSHSYPQKTPTTVGGRKLREKAWPSEDDSALLLFGRRDVQYDTFHLRVFTGGKKGFLCHTLKKEMGQEEQEKDD